MHSLLELLALSPPKMGLLRSVYRDRWRQVPVGPFVVVLALFALYVGLIVLGLLAIEPVPAVLHR